MSDVKSLWQRLLHDIQVELSEEFDRNFERKAFFDFMLSKRCLKSC